MSIRSASYEARTINISLHQIPMKSSRTAILNKTVLSLSLFGLILTTGCASQKFGAANIMSDPVGAEIINLKDDTNLGRTPAKVVWRGEASSSEMVTLQLRKKGYKAAIATVWINKRHNSEEEAKEFATDVFTELQKEPTLP